MTPAEIAASYAAQGWHTVRLAPLEKRPISARWTEHADPPEDFADNENIGVALGQPSGGLVDVDLDCAEAVALAPSFLPPTLTFGRASKPRSHWLYYAPGIPRVQRPKLSHIELRSTGGQTMMPGSLHPDTGEEIVWCDTPDAPSRLTADVLRSAWCRLGVATLLARALPSLTPRPGQGGGVHDLCLAIAGSLKRVGWPLDAVLHLVEHALGDGPPHRLEAVHATYGREDGDPLTGWPTLERLIGLRECGELKRFAEDPAHGYRPLADQVLAEVAHPRNDLGNALRLLDRYGRDLRFVPGLGWHRFVNTHWAPTDTPMPEAQRIAAELEGSTLEGTAGAALRKWGVTTGNAGRLAAMITIASHQPEIRLDPADLDSDPYTLATPAGILDLRTATVRPATREDLNTRLTPIAPDHEHPTPRWDRFLEETHPDPATRAYLLRWLGYCLTADVSEHAFAIWWGAKGRNGKSVALNLLRRILGDHACDVATDTLLRKPVGQHPTALLDFRGRRLMIASELPEGRALDDALIRQLTGGDTIRARAMGRDFVSFAPQHKLVIACNDRPPTRTVTPAFWARVQILPWTVSFLGREDRHLEHELAQEAPGIFAQLARSTADWIAHRLSPPPALAEALAEYRRAQDILAAFLDEVLESGPGFRISHGDLYRAYAHWCTETGERADSRTVLFRKLEERGVARTTSHGTRYFLGYRIRKKVRDTADRTG